MGLADAPLNMAYGGCLIKARIMQAVFLKISITGQKKTPPVKAGLFYYRRRRFTYRVRFWVCFSQSSP